MYSKDIWGYIPLSNLVIPYINVFREFQGLTLQTQWEHLGGTPTTLAFSRNSTDTWTTRGVEDNRASP